MASTTSKRTCSRPKDRQRSKSGCITCRKRKVKCDEAYPACCRCISTGRACDGYGVWGGGGRNGKLNGLGWPREGVVAATTSPKPLYIPLLIASVVEKEHFDWFRYHTLSKLPGSFDSDFWGTLLPQACLSERAVFNAVLALSSVHRGGSRSPRRGNDNKEPASMKPANKAEIFTLEHYLQAITHLQPYFTCQDKAAFRITLIVCIVFVSIDLLSGNFTSAQNHVRGGLRLIADMQQQVSSDINNDPVSKFSGTAHSKAGIGDSTDHSIMEVLSRLYIQIKLCRPLSSHLDIAVPFKIPSPYPLLHKFDSCRSAWLELDRQLHRIFHLASQARHHQGNSATSSPLSITMVRLQHSVLVDLEHWIEILKASKESLLGNESVEYQKAYCILAMYHTMATIMAHTCVHEDESVFDDYTELFILLTEQAATLCSIPGGSLDQSMPPSDETSFDTSRSIVDVGCLPQLYYTALKCRIHWVRHRAVDILQPLIHREGLWDARIAATVAKRVVEVEEGDYYKSFKMTEDSSSESSLPALPECYRLRDAEVVYSGEPFDKVLLFCKGKQSDNDRRRVCIGQYEVSSHKWVDVVEE